jgi:hypothetical protein
LVFLVFFLELIVELLLALLWLLSDASRSGMTTALLRLLITT